MVVSEKPLEFWEDIEFQKLPLESQAKLRVVMSAYDSVLHKGSRECVSYITMFITSGLRLYQTLQKYGVSSLEMLNKKYPGSLFGDVIQPNIQEGIAFGEMVSRDYTDIPVVIPGVMEGKPQRWTQVEYMILWKWLLRHKAVHQFLHAGWEYSNGGVDEYVRCTMLNYGWVVRPHDIVVPKVPSTGTMFHVRDHQNQLVRIEEASHMISRAICDIRDMGFGHMTGTLQEQLKILAGFALVSESRGVECLWRFHTQLHDELRFDALQVIGSALDALDEDEVQKEWFYDVVL